MSVFHKILVPLDGSEHSDRALATALQIAKNFNGEITLLHVYSVTATPVVIPEPTTLNPTGVPIATSAEVSKMVDAARDAGKRKLADGSIEELHTRQDIKHTLLTRQRDALKMAKGRWRTKPIRLTLEKIKSLLKGDMKRRRANYDSYGLVMQHHSEPSQTWSYQNLLFELEGSRVCTLACDTKQ